MSNTELVTLNNELTVKTRAFTPEPLSPYAKPVDIWYSNQWLPAYFSDLREGDFFLILDNSLSPTECFYCAGNVYSTNSRGGLTFIMPRGCSVVQRPALELKDINTLANDEVNNTHTIKQLTRE